MFSWDVANNIHVYFPGQKLYSVGIPVLLRTAVTFLFPFALFHCMMNL